MTSEAVKPTQSLVTSQICKKCDNVASVSMCDVVEICNKDEVCYMRKYINDMFNERFDLGCVEASILWTFSIYLECVAMLPQFWMMIWNGEAGRFVCFYLCAMGSYRVFYIIHWIYIEDSNGGNLNLISFFSGNLQSCLYLVFLTVYINKLRESRKQKIKPSSTLQDGLIMTLSPRWPGFGVQRDL
ncbi:KDELR [Mytilus edulis]|uniref:KDELR n=1 Tax=Mytilus edulis TaxID=6550 RepID=A0A8S3U2M7_MYTED|nr:KDELR [Mytilus edulis]